MAEDWETAAAKPVPVVPVNKFGKETMTKWLLDSEVGENKFVCMILGDDGTAKSPLALSHMTDEDIKAGKRVVVLDLDGGNGPLINSYHKERCEKLGRKASDVFLVKNPLSILATDKGVAIDYITTLNQIKGVINLLKDPATVKTLNIKYVIFDGLSTLLQQAEFQMRIEKHLDADNGVNMAYWKRRNKYFKECLESLKSLPFSSFFIAHADFIQPETAQGRKDWSSIKKQTHAMMHQKIICEKVFEKGRTVFKATINKSKYNIKVEGKQIIFGTVDKEGVTFEPEKVLEGLI